VLYHAAFVLRNSIGAKSKTHLQPWKNLMIMRLSVGLGKILGRISKCQANGVLDHYELERYKPWFDKEFLKLIGERKQAKLQEVLIEEDNEIGKVCNMYINLVLEIQMIEKSFNFHLHQIILVIALHKNIFILRDAQRIHCSMNSKAAYNTNTS
jgi:hypothetical protein